ncbi:MAG: hypothetical protein ACPLPT_01665 [Moorellales bacterium]
MLARAYGVTLLGLEAHLVEVEVDVGPGLPHLLPLSQLLMSVPQVSPLEKLNT